MHQQAQPHQHCFGCLTTQRTLPPKGFPKSHLTPPLFPWEEESSLPALVQPKPCRRYRHILLQHESLACKHNTAPAHRWWMQQPCGAPVPGTTAPAPQKGGLHWKAPASALQRGGPSHARHTQMFPVSLPVPLFPSDLQARSSCLASLLGLGSATAKTHPR